MSQLVFDDDVSAKVEAAYRARDILRRRRLVRDALAATPGQRILDVGCGPGFYAAELLEQVGPDGAVVGIDSSAQMLAIAERRCAGFDNVAFHEADATALPVGDREFDAALTVQVLEYVPEPAAALAEIHRALRPGGRVVVWDVDWATVSWHSEDPARMDRALAAWDDHLTHRSLPRTLAAQLRAAGFGDVAVEAHAFVAADLSPETYVGAIFPLIGPFVARHHGDAEAEAWAGEQRDLSARGDFFFTCTQFLFSATRR
jgi:ubiquinone/menaquinone biosynthesis C-methylase UbiE